MSTNSECLFVQKSTDEWYYILESPFKDDGDYDWLDTAQAYGPFPTEDAADEHLRDNHPNPGGSNSQPLPEGVSEIDLSKDDQIKRLLSEAQSPSRDRGFGYRMR